MSKILELTKLIKCQDVVGVKSFLDANSDLNINQTFSISDVDWNKEKLLKCFCAEPHISPLEFLCWGPWNEEIFQLLISAGADVNWTGTSNHHYTPLILANRPGNLGAVKSLVRNGANANQTDLKKQSPLARAAYVQDIEITKWLLDNGADIYTFHPDKCALVVACSRGHFEIFCYLFEKMSHASEEQKNARYQISDYIPGLVTEEHNLFDFLYRNCLRRATAGNTEGHIQCAEMLIQSGCIEIGVADSAKAGMLSYIDPLSLAVSTLNAPVVKLLLRADCDVNTPRNKYLSLIDMALDRKWWNARLARAAISVIELLVQAGYEVKDDLSKYKNTAMRIYMYDGPQDFLTEIADVIASNDRRR